MLWTRMVEGRLAALRRKKELEIANTPSERPFFVHLLRAGQNAWEGKKPRAMMVLSESPAQGVFIAPLGQPLGMRERPILAKTPATVHERNSFFFSLLFLSLLALSDFSGSSESPGVFVACLDETKVGGFSIGICQSCVSDV